jgi:AcrR family transcriptional regulator
LQAFFLMPTRIPEVTDRKPRADAQRNREPILEVAKQEFTRSGAGARLEGIARRAGVGPGTLYRHFLTREELLAVYRSEMEKLAAAERNFADTLPAVEALRAWLLLFVDAVETKQIIAPVLNTLVGDPKKVFEASYAQRAATCARTLTRSIFFALLLAWPKSRPAPTGSKARTSAKRCTSPQRRHSARLNQPF